MHIRTSLAAGLVATVVALGAPPIADAKTETLRVFEQQISFTYTTADGTVSHAPPAGQPQPGDKLEIDSRIFNGTHRKHAKRATMSSHLECTFGTGPEPDCLSWTASAGRFCAFAPTA